MDAKKINMLVQLINLDFQDITLLFNLNNYFFPALLEYSKSCDKCRTRVINRIKENQTELLEELKLYLLTLK